MACFKKLMFWRKRRTTRQSEDGLQDFASKLQEEDKTAHLQMGVDKHYRHLKEMEVTGQRILMELEKKMKQKEELETVLRRRFNKIQYHIYQSERIRSRLESAFRDAGEENKKQEPTFLHSKVNGMESQMLDMERKKMESEAVFPTQIDVCEKMEEEGEAALHTEINIMQDQLLKTESDEKCSTSALGDGPEEQKKQEQEIAALQGQINKMKSKMLNMDKDKTALRNKYKSMKRLACQTEWERSRLEHVLADAAEEYMKQEQETVALHFQRDEMENQLLDSEQKFHYMHRDHKNIEAALRHQIKGLKRKLQEDNNTLNQVGAALRCQNEQLKKELSEQDGHAEETEAYLLRRVQPIEDIFQDVDVENVDVACHRQTEDSEKKHQEKEENNLEERRYMDDERTIRNWTLFLEGVIVGTLLNVAMFFWTRLEW